MAFKEKVITLFLFIIFFGETSNNLYDVNLPEEHLPFYLSSFPSVAEQCDKDPDCVLKVGNISLFYFIYILCYLYFISHCNNKYFIRNFLDKKSVGVMRWTASKIIPTQYPNVLVITGVG